ncbi:MAG: DUF4430 domain-containing protein [Candidatus Zixiibacteriota bacterium]
MTRRLIAGSALIACLLTSCGNKGKKDQADISVPSGADSTVIALVGRDSVSVLDLLKESHTVNSWGTVMGTYVESIDSLKNSSTVFWIYSVNDSIPQVASDKWMTRTGDRVAWHFRKLSGPDTTNNR